ncbi:MAG: Fic family protein [Microcella sp.]|nr:Fic family protein [Microcella sp.]
MLSSDGSLQVPRAARERRSWRPRDTGYYSRRELERQSGEYESIIPIALADWQPSIAAELVAELDDATSALIDFDSYADRRLGTGDATLGPMAAILLRSESASSSQIENLTTSARQLAMAELGEPSAANSRTVVGNVRAMEAALALADRLEADTILQMHQALLQHQEGMAEHAGKWRDELVWIGPGDAGPLTAEFVAPHHEHLPAALDDLVTFMARNDLPVLLHVAVAHAQFETLHPFVDGNGRTGRALAQAMLKAKRVVTRSTVPLSSGLLVDIDGYFAALSAFREGDAAPIALRFAHAALFAAATGVELIDALADALEDARAKLTGVRSDAAAHRVLPLLIGQPIVTSGYLTRTLGINEVAAKRAVDTLVERDVLVETSGRSRNRTWAQPGMLAALDRYARGVRRGRR